MRKTKIVCTLGPNENDYELMKKLAEKMDVARFNFSHGSHQEHLGRLALLKQARKDTGREIAALLDIPEETVRTRLARAREKLKHILSEVPQYA